MNPEGARLTSNDGQNRWKRLFRQLGVMNARKPLNDALASGRQVDLDPTPIALVRPAFDKAELLAARDERNRAVMVRLQPLGADIGAASRSLHVQRVR